LSFEELQVDAHLSYEQANLLRAADANLLAGGDRTLRQTLDFLVRGTRRLIKSDQACMLFRIGRTFEQVFSTGGPDIGKVEPLTAFLLADCIEANTAAQIGDIRDTHFLRHSAERRPDPSLTIRSIVAAPITIRGITTGVLAAYGSDPDFFKTAHRNAVESIAVRASILLSEIPMFDIGELRSCMNQILLQDPTAQPSATYALQEVIQSLGRLPYVHFSSASILFSHGADLEIVCSTNTGDTGLILGSTSTISGRALNSGESVVTSDHVLASETRRTRDVALKSAIAVPIILAPGSTAVGVFNVQSEELDAFQGMPQAVLESFAEKTAAMLALIKLRLDVTEFLEVRSADELLMALGDQSSNMVHRINNTVGAMRFRVMELQEFVESHDEKSAKFLVDSLAALRALAEQTLRMPDEVTRLLGRQVAIVNADEAVRDALERLRLPSDVILQLDLESNPAPLPLYGFDIVVQNLLRNAIDAMPSGGYLKVSTSSRLSPDKETGYFELSVRDSGIGIPQDVLPNIFDLNFSTKPGEKRGLGLGLWWTRNFVRRAKGNIVVTSNVGEGTCVLVRIPYSFRLNDDSA
jgi:signal transduction histidine kinase